MSRLCWSTRETKVYLAIGKGCYGFSWSSSSISHLWSYEGFLEDVRVVVEGITGLLAISSGRSIHILDPYTPAKPRVSWMDAHKDTIYAMHFDPQTGVLFSSGKDRCIKAWEVLNEELSLMGTAPEAHQNWVMAIQFNPQNRLMITAGVDGLVRAWRFDSSGNFSALATSEEVHADGILSLCSNMASNISISSGKDGCLQLWRYQPGTLRMVACEADCNHQGWVRGLQFDPSSGLVVSSGDDGAIRVFRYKEECFTAIAEMLEAHPSGILGLQFCSKTMRVLSAGEDGSVRCWALDCDAKNIVLQGKVEDAHDGKTVSHIQYDSRSKLVVTAGSDLHLRAWLLSDDLTFTAMASCQGEGILALQLDSEEDICYCAHADSSITVWQVDVGQGQLRHIATEADAHSGRILAFSFTQVSKMLWTAGVDKAIRAWQLQGQELRMVSRSTQFLNSGVLALAYDAKTGIVLSAGMRGDIKACRHSGDRLVPIELESVDHSEGLLMLQFAGSTVISGGLDGALRAWRLTLASVKRVNEPMKAHQGWSRAIHYDLKNGYVASCGDDGHVKAWTLDGETLRPAGSALGAHPDGARGVLINGGHGLVLSCGDDGVIKALKMTDWASELVSSGDHPGPVFNLQYFDPQVVSCSVDGTIKAWKMDREGALKFHAQSAEESRPTLAMKYDPSTRTIFTAGFDGAVQVWRLEDHGITLLSSIQAHEGTIRTMQFDRPARTLVTAGEDGALRAWRFKDGKLAKLAVLEEAVGSEIHVIAYLGRKNMVIAACADASLRAWEMVNKTFKEVCKVETAHVNVINAMHYNAELSTIFTACHSVRIWKFESKLSELHHLPTPFGQHSVTALRYSHALSLLVGCSTTGAISSWFYCGSGPPLALWQVESAHVRGTVSVVFDSHRSLLLTGGNDKTLKTWRLLGDLQFICAATESGKSKIFTACPKQFEW